MNGIERPTPIVSVTDLRTHFPVGSGLRSRLRRAHHGVYARDGGSVDILPRET